MAKIIEIRYSVLLLLLLQRPSEIPPEKSLPQGRDAAGVFIALSNHHHHCHPVGVQAYMGSRGRGMLPRRKTRKK